MKTWRMANQTHSQQPIWAWHKYLARTTLGPYGCWLQKCFYCLAKQLLNTAAQAASNFYAEKAILNASYFVSSLRDEDLDISAKNKHSQGGMENYMDVLTCMFVNWRIFENYLFLGVPSRGYSWEIYIRTLSKYQKYL